MRTLRLFLYGIPAALLILLAAAFLNATFLSVAKKNEMSIGTLGEPSTLNPIQQADSASSQVGGLIFNGLIKYNQNLEIVGDLATKWELSQETTFEFATVEEAERLKIRWQSILLFGRYAGLVPAGLQKYLESCNPVTSIETQGTKVIVLLNQAGQTFSNILLSDLKTNQFSPLSFPPLEPGGKERPCKAEPIIRFNLRDGVRWHDGAPFTSADVAFTYRAIMNEKVASPRRSDFELVDSVETPDARTVVVRYKKPFSPALLSWMTAILPEHILGKLDPSKWPEVYNRAPVGTGPFKFGEWKTNEFIRLKKNPDYFLGSPWLDSVVFRVLPDPLTLQLAFQTRQVDFWNVDPWAVKGLQGDPRFDLFSAPGNAYNYIGWNLRRPMFQDLKVRQALAQAVNIPQMIKYILYGHGVQATGIFTPQMWFFDPSVKPLAYDPEAAKKLLDEAGWKPGADGIRVKNGQRFSFTLLSNNGNEVRRDIATLVQDDLKQVGIEVKVEIYEWAVLLKRFVNKGEFDAIVLGWGLGYDFDQYSIWHSSQTHPEELNFVGFSDPKVDHLLTDLRQEYARPEIIRIAGKLQQTIYGQQPYLFLFVPEGTEVMWKGAYRLRHPGPDGTWIDEPVHMTKAGWSYDMEWFYRPECTPKPTANTITR
jgi:ABC-type transport system substrate-binding protein